MELIRQGQRSQAVEDLQSRLRRLGFEITGDELGVVFGPSTQAAIMSFQQQRGLDTDGVVGPNTWRELIESSWRLGDRLLRLSRPHLRGDDVRDLQSRLNALGFSAGKHDGIFGFKTLDALKDFQSNLALEEDGIAGHETVAALNRLTFFIRHGLQVGQRTRERVARVLGKPGIAGKRIAIDPGHGGKDTGEFGPSRETESELTFTLGARLAQLVDGVGGESVLTRGPHDGPSETERAQLANDSEADLLISIHLNSNRSESAEGAAAYYFESAGVASEPGEHLAGIILDSLTSAGRVDCRAHGKTYPLLRETRMPAVIIEPAFITNPAEAKLLTDPRSAGEIARAIFSALARYFS